MSEATIRPYKPSLLTQLKSWLFNEGKSKEAQKEDQKIYNNYYGNYNPIKTTDTTEKDTTVKTTPIKTTPIKTAVKTTETPTNNDNGDGNSLMDEATRIYNAKKNAILSKLQTMKEEASRLRTSAKGQFDFTTGEVKKNYEALKNLSKEKLAQALEGLTQEDTSVQNMYGRVAGNARRAMESALMRNRMLHRAMGSLGSSFYSNTQGDTTNQGMNTVNDTALEEAAKRSAIGTAKSKTNTDFAQNDLAIGAEETQLNNDAMKEYNDAIANADMLEKNYNIDSTEAIDEADSKLTSSLEAIKKYVQDKTLATKAGGATSGTLGNFVKSYDAISPIKPVLDKTEKYQGANNFIANAGKVGTLGSGFSNLIASASNNLDQYNPNSPNYFLKPKKKATEDPNQYFINPIA